MPIDENWTTVGDFATEADSVEAIVSSLGDQWFRVYREVPGRYLFARPGTGTKNPRADLIIVPRRATVDKGWRFGAIGVECKRSGRRMNPLIAQVLDYQGAVFYPDADKFEDPPSGTGIVPTFWALWPATAGIGSSLLAHRRIFTVNAGYGGRLVFYAAGAHVLTVEGDRLEVGKVIGGFRRGPR